MQILTGQSELHSSYNLSVICVPPHRPSRRVDHPIGLLFNATEKMKEVARVIRESHARGRPVLVGTGSIEESERLSERLVSPSPFYKCGVGRCAVASAKGYHGALFEYASLGIAPCRPT